MEASNICHSNPKGQRECISMSCTYSDIYRRSKSVWRLLVELGGARERGDTFLVSIVTWFLSFALGGSDVSNEYGNELGLSHLKVS